MFCVVITEEHNVVVEHNVVEHNVVVNSEELIGTTEYLTL
jgi:hypothetical protein